MTLSEAIRVGSKKRPNQAFGVLFDKANDATCALGAAADALGILDTRSSNAYKGQPPVEWKAFCFRFVKCPECGCGVGKNRVDDMVVHLNNAHKWSREHIATWVELLEQATAVDAVDPHAGNSGNTSTRA